jgi:hypothetical protein
MVCMESIFHCGCLLFIMEHCKGYMAAVYEPKLHLCSHDVTMTGALSNAPGWDVTSAPDRASS